MTPFHEGSAFNQSVRGFLHRPKGAPRYGLVLTHGAGGNCKAPLLAAIANAFCAAGVCVLRCDLPFRQKRPFGPPSPATSGQDREGLRAAVSVMQNLVSAPVTLGGHSYGGRQATILAAEDPDLCRALLLFSYPLHPPGKPSQLRTAHFPVLRTPALFVHGTKDEFGAVEEMQSALGLIPAQTELMIVEGAGHDLRRGKLDLESVVQGFSDKFLGDG
jgi:hypothetical protein